MKNGNVRNHLVLLAALAALTAGTAACSDHDDEPQQPPVVVPDPTPDPDPETPEEPRVAVALNAGIVQPADARAARPGEWLAGDSIGLYLLSPGTKEPVEENENRHYATAGGGASAGFAPVTPADTAFYPAGDRAEVELLAYHPYRPGLRFDEATGCLLLPVDVAEQADVMTARATASRHNPAVRMDFHHRLTRLLFSLSGGINVSEWSLRGARLTLRGMHTRGLCHLSDGSVTPTGEPGDLPVSLNADGTEGELMVLPCADAQGTELRVELANGDVYTARIKAGTPLKPGTSNLFRLDLDHLYTDPSHVDLGATVVDWQAGIDEALTASLVEMNVYPGADATTGFAPGDEVTVWAGFTDGAGTAYTFDGTAWSSPSPFYWDELTGSEVTFSARRLPAATPEGNRMPDILTGSVSVQRYHPVNLKFGHAMSQLTVMLKAGTDMTQAEVDAATVTIPSARVGYTLEGITLAPTDETGTITLDGTGNRRTALLLPQTITGQLLGIVIGGQEYKVAATGQTGTFAAGRNNTLTVTVNKTAVSVNFSINEWQPGYEGSGDADMDIKGK